MKEASETQDKDRGEDPGAARFGNFINYYSFNPPENRMKNIPGDLLNRLEHTESPVTILDIGCNAGVSSWSCSRSEVPDRVRKPQVRTETFNYTFL